MEDEVVVVAIMRDPELRDACQRATANMGIRVAPYYVSPDVDRSLVDRSLVDRSPPVEFVLIKGMGLGLVASKNINKNDTIIRETRIKVVHESKVPEDIDPHDRQVFLIGRRVIIDTNPGPPGLWHVLNHSKDGKADIRVLKGLKDEVIGLKVVAKRNIKEGEAITWDYREPDPEWG